MREPLSAVDAAWLRMDRPANTADVVALLSFRTLPPEGVLRELVHARLVERCPRFRQRIARGSALGGDAWVDDDAFSLERHVITHRVRSSDARALRDLVSEVATEGFDPSHPLWRLHLAHTPDGGAAVVKVHHCVGDGFALVGLFLSLADEPVERAGNNHVLPAARRLSPWLDPAAALRSAVRDPAEAVKLLSSTADMAAALARMALIPAAPRTVLSRALCGRRRVAWSRGLPLPRLREIARLHGATINELLAAAVAGALRGHLAAEGDRPDDLELRAMVPVNLRERPPEPGTSLGNRFGLAFLELPVAAATPEARVAAVRANSAQVKAGADALAAFGVLAALGRVPLVEGLTTSFFSRKASLVLTNVPGPKEPLHLAGNRVEEAMFWVPHPAELGLGLSILSYAGEVRLGVRADVAVMPEPGDLVRRFEAELTALGAVAHDVAPARVAAPA